MPIVAHSLSALPIPTIARFSLLLPRTEARKKHDKHAQEQQHHSRKTSPHTYRMKTMRAIILLVDMIFNRLLQ